jgi:hypothetical protein
MERGIGALICGALAIISGSLCLIAGAGGFGGFISALFAIALWFAAGIFAQPAIRKNAPKDAPGYKPSVIGFILGFIGFFEALASIFLSM